MISSTNRPNANSGGVFASPSPSQVKCCTPSALTQVIAVATRLHLVPQDLEVGLVKDLVIHILITFVFLFSFIFFGFPPEPVFHSLWEGISI